MVSTGGFSSPAQYSLISVLNTSLCFSVGSVALGGKLAEASAVRGFCFPYWSKKDLESSPPSTFRIQTVAECWGRGYLLFSRWSELVVLVRGVEAIKEEDQNERG